MEWSFGPMFSPKSSAQPDAENDRWGPRDPGVPGPSMSEWQARAELLFDMVEELLGGGPEGWEPDANGEFPVSSGCAWCGSFSGHNPNDWVDGELIYLRSCPWARWRHFLTGSTQG